MTMCIKETGKLVCGIISDNSDYYKATLTNYSQNDWKTLFSFLKNYNLVPLFYYKLKTLNLFDLVPENLKKNFYGILFFFIFSTSKAFP